MTLGEFIQRTIGLLGFAPNAQQRMVIESLARFCSPGVNRALEEARGSLDRVFVLNGYAGTGKTSLCGALVRALAEAGIRSVLMAPTGRAAKVFSAFAGSPAYTIHRKIYRHALGAGAPGLQENHSSDTIFIVDEASMIGAEGDGGGYTSEAGLLLDLVQYVYSGERCRLVLIGDTAQLPPVGSDVSPAMNVDVLRSLGLSVSRATLTAVARQDYCSGILANATRLRRQMRQLEAGEQPGMPQFSDTDGFGNRYGDVIFTDPADLPEAIETCYRRDGIDQTVLITRANRTAVDFNRAIRNQVLYLDEELCGGELLMVAKNNYYWSRRVKGLDFIANGDTLAVVRVYGTEERYGLRFANVRLTLPDNETVVFDAKIMLDTLCADATGMAPGHGRRLYEGILAEAGGGDPAAVPADARGRLLAQSPYWNALQVKYAYAVTCHKAQGGQWQNVFVDAGYVPDEANGAELYRWLYTAVTRARTRLFIIRPAD